MKKLLTGAGITALFFVARLAWNLITAEPIPEPTDADVAAEAAENDALVAEELAAGDAAPALNWLAEPGNMLFEGDPRSVQALIEGMYAAGATDVWFTGIEEFAGKHISASIAVGLPDDADARGRILKAEADFWESDEPVQDVGQRYLIVPFD